MMGQQDSDTSARREPLAKTSNERPREVTALIRFARAVAASAEKKRSKEAQDGKRID